MYSLGTVKALAAAAAALVSSTWACADSDSDSCYGPQHDVVQTRNVRRMQPEAQKAVDYPTRPLEWGQLNFLHTTDTHGWLEGHLKEPNYGADWGDYKSFVRHMRDSALVHNVDLLLVDTGDLHDGAGLSDATMPINGVVSNPIFENIDYDLLTIGNHELYITEIAYETFQNFSKVYGDRYLTSNVQILNPATNQFEYIGKTYRYFTTPKGLRIMAFGFLYDFTGNSNVSKVIKAATVVQQQWFKDAVNYKEPVDLFVMLGHNPPRPGTGGSTFGTYYNAVRQMRPDVPIQVFGGHTHVRDFVVYPDGKGTGLESGRYCETLGWLAMAGIKSVSYRGSKLPFGLPHPTQKATPPPAKNGTTGGGNSTANATDTGITYARRYLDWNRATFEFHSFGAINDITDRLFDVPFQGQQISKQITDERKALKLSTLYGCAPQTWCISCAPFLSSGSIFSLLQKALATTVVSPPRKDKPRLIIINTGSVRFDLPKGPFTYDDSFIVSPFNDTFQYLPDVPYGQASQVLNILNKGAYQRRESEPELSRRDFAFQPLSPGLPQVDECVDPPYEQQRDSKRDASPQGGVIRRSQVTPGYTTKDDFGTDGDDTAHSAIPYYPSPNDLQANASFPADGSKPAAVDIIFLDFIAPNIVAALKQTGAAYTAADVKQYLPVSNSTNTYLPAYAKQAPDWQKDVPNCPVGPGIGYTS